MLLQLCVKNFTIIDQANIDFSNGMTIITGETGAGKSICIDALAMLLGARADSKVVKEGAERCDINAAFDIHDIHAAQKWLTENELDSDDECILRRTINQDGRSRNYINGQTVTLTQLRELSQYLINIHSQHQHQQLLQRNKQRDLLDSFASNQNLCKQIHTIYTDWRQTMDELQQCQSDAVEKSSRSEFLRFQADELLALEIKENEFEQLTQEQQQLANADQLLAVCNSVTAVHSENTEHNTLQTLAQDLQQLAKFNNIESIGASIECFNTAYIQLEEGCRELQNFMQQLDLNPERLHQIEERMGQLHSMARKHHVEPDHLLDKQQSLLAELDSLDNQDEHIKQLSQRCEQWLQEYQQLAKQLHTKRQKAAKKLANAVTASIQELNMAGGVCKIDVINNDDSTPTAHGNDLIDFLVSTNPGQSLQALNKVVSGGELSRISLAIQVIAAKQEQAATLVFDEVDVGIGGSTAEIVGKLLKEISQHTQVLCITHLAQVAAQGDHHFQVSKQSKGDKTTTQIVPLDNDLRVYEIARMLGGVEITDTSLEHAKEMLGTTLTL